MNEDFIFRSLQVLAIIVIMITTPIAHRYSIKKGWKKDLSKEYPSPKDQRKLQLKAIFIIIILIALLLLLRKWVHQYYL